VVLLRTETWRRIFDVRSGVATDLVVSVANPNEIGTVTLKILEKLPDARVIDRESILKTYEVAFSWRGSVVVLAFAGALAAFGILAWDRAAGLTADERRDLGILKGIGWTVADVMKLKLWEGAIISITAFLTGGLAAHLHVFHFGAGALVPFIKGWSVMFPEFQLKPEGEVFQMATVFMFTVLPYIALMLVPAWTAAITDPDRVMRA
jgi:ABC-type lipoprotein release transport system permease subunit